MGADWIAHLTMGVLVWLVCAASSALMFTPQIGETIAVGNDFNSQFKNSHADDDRQVERDEYEYNNQFNRIANNADRNPSNTVPDGEHAPVHGEQLAPKYMIELYNKFESDRYSHPMANIVRSFFNVYTGELIKVCRFIKTDSSSCNNISVGFIIRIVNSIII